MNVAETFAHISKIMYAMHLADRVGKACGIDNVTRMLSCNLYMACYTCRNVNEASEPSQEIIDLLVEKIRANTDPMLNQDEYIIRSAIEFVFSGNVNVPVIVSPDPQKTLLHFHSARPASPPDWFRDLRDELWNIPENPL